MKSNSKHLKFIISALFIFGIIISFQKMGIGQLEASSRSEMSKWIDQLQTNQLFNKVDQNVVKDNTEQYSLTSNHTMLTFPVTLQYKAYIILTTDTYNQEKIVEYGIGNYLPYQKDVIINQEIRELNPQNFRYLSPIESYWNYDVNNERVQIEGSTGEWLPVLNEESLTSVMTQTLTYQDTLTESITDERLSFNVKDDLSWLTDFTKESTLTSKEIQSKIKEKQMLFLVGTKYQNSVKFAYPIIGYHLWNTDKLFLAIHDDEMNLVRFISFEDLKQYGYVIPVN